jgi:hypothetical protein
MAWDLEFEDPFGEWWQRLTSDEQDTVDFLVQLLAAHGPSIGVAAEPSATKTFHGPVREVRATDSGRTHRVLYTFEPGHSTIVLLGGTILHHWARMYGTSKSDDRLQSRYRC